MFRPSLLALLLVAGSAHADGLQPDGCYRLGAVVPKAAFNGFTSVDVSANHFIATDHEICLEAKNVQPAKDNIRAGDFAVRVRKGAKTLVTYNAKALLRDGSGGHDDFVFAATADVLRKIGNADAYARGDRGPIENTIFYILPNDTKTGPVKRKSGDFAGTVTIGDLKYALLVR